MSDQFVRCCNSGLGESEQIINEAIGYLEQMAGIKYAGWRPSMGFRDEDGPPFWKVNSHPPPIQIIRKGGLCCTGLPNLVRRNLGLEVPGNVTGQRKSKYTGTTGAWFHYLNSSNRLQRIDFSKCYPKGTLLLQDYNSLDQGHVAVLTGANKTRPKNTDTLLNNIQIHASSCENSNCVVLEPLADYHLRGRYTHVCLPQNWLLKN